MAPAPTGGVIDWAAGISGPVTISGWQSTGAEGDALTQTLCAAQAALPNLQITYQPIAGDYQAVMAANFAARDVPDLFYVNADCARVDQPEASWPLDDRTRRSPASTPATSSRARPVFKGADGPTTAFPRTSTPSAWPTTRTSCPTRPPTLDELVTATAPGARPAARRRCASTRGSTGPRVHLRPGRLAAHRGRHAATIDSEASTAAVQWYLDLFKNGLGMTASDMGDGWCGDALGKGVAAITFEGGWLDPAMTSTYPDITMRGRRCRRARPVLPVTISFTASYSIGADCPEPGPGVRAADLPHRCGRHAGGPQGGVALPSRDDVPTPAGKEVLAAESAYAKPGSGFMPGYAASRRRSGASSPTRSRTRRTTRAGGRHDQGRHRHGPRRPVTDSA